MGTEIDNLQIKIEAEADAASKAISKFVGQLDDLQKKLKGTANATDMSAVTEETKKLAAAFRDVGKDFNFKGTTKQLEAEIAKTEKRLVALARKESEAKENGIDPKSKAWTNLQYDITKTLNKLQSLYDKQKEIAAIDPTAGMTITIDGVVQSFEAWADSLKEVGIDTENAKKQTEELNASIRNTVGGFASPANGGLSSLKMKEPAEETSNIIPERLRSAADELIRSAGLGGSKEFNHLVNQIQKAESALERLFTRQERMQFQGIKEGSASFRGLQYDIENAEYKLRDLYAALLNTSIATDHVSKQVSEGFGKRLQNNISALSGKFRSLTGNVNKSNKAISSGNFGLKNMIVNGLVMSAVFRTVSLLISGVGKGFENLAQYSSITNNSISALRSGLLQLGNGFAAAFSPILNFVTPVLNQLISMLNAAASAISQFFAILTGQSTYISAKNNFQDYAAGLDGVGGSAGGAADAMKELKRETLGFDEITKLSDNASASGGSGGGSGAGAAAGDLFETKEVDSALRNNILEWLDKLKTKAGPAVKALQKLRKEGLAKLGSFTFEALKDFYSNFLVPVGDWTLDKGLPRLLEVTNAFLNNIDWDTINASLERFWKALAPFATGIGEGLINFYEDLTKVGADFINAVVPGGLDSLSSALESFDIKKVESLGYALGVLGTAIAGLKIKNTWLSKLAKLFGLGKTAKEVPKLATFLKGFSIGDFTQFMSMGIGTPAFDVIGNKIMDGISVSLQKILPDWAYNALSNIGAGLALGAAAGTIIPGLGTVAGALIGGLIGNLASFDYEEFWNTIKDGWDRVKGKALEITANVRNDAKTWWKNTKSWWSKKVGKVEEFVTTVKNNAKTWWSNVKEWWTTEIGPGTVTEFITSVKNNAKTWWSNVKEWWTTEIGPGTVTEFITSVKNNAVAWWSNTKSYWNEKVGSVAKFATDVKNQASTWWSNAKSYWNGVVGSVSDFKTSVKNQADTWWGNVTTWWNNYTKGKHLSVTAKVHGTSDGGTAGGRTGSFANGGVYKNGKWSPITAYAGGGLPNMGELFVARESGPELVGRMGGGTAVMNNNQIVSSVSAGVYQAVAAAMNQFSGGQVAEVHVHLEGDAEGVFRLVKSVNDSRVIATGQPALLA